MSSIIDSSLNYNQRLVGYICIGLSFVCDYIPYLGTIKEPLKKTGDFLVSSSILI